MGSAFDIKAEFDVVVVAIADAAVAGGRDDEKGINIHAKTFRSKEGEEGRTLCGLHRMFGANSHQQISQPMENPTRATQGIRRRPLATKLRASKATELWHDATSLGQRRDFQGRIPRVGLGGCIMSVCVAEYQSPSFSGGTLLPDCNSATDR